MTENIMKHIAKVTKRDPLKVRLANMNDVDKVALESMIKDLSKSADYEMRKRAVETFNNENRWKKKGIALVPMKYLFGYFGQFNAMVSVCARNGTVCVTHSGIECGQGINTKVAQVAAYTFGIDLSLVTVKPTNNIITPNNTVTGEHYLIGLQSSENNAISFIINRLIKTIVALILGHDSGLQTNPEETRADKKRYEESKLAGTCFYCISKGC
ncbi:uncharacterized protein [Temnothorax nylanderi]|uniref:uncharacterized protein n=1 Tax=Temnothorax nylanderi TaxID=102681 RepID=UPI003A87CCEA